MSKAEGYVDNSEEIVVNNIIQMSIADGTEEQKIPPKNRDTIGTLQLDPSSSQVVTNSIQSRQKWTELKSLTIPKDFWETYWNSSQTLKDGWSDDFNNIFNEEHHYCVLSFRWHKCVKQPKRGACSFIGRAFCKHSTCAEYKLV